MKTCKDYGVELCVSCRSNEMPAPQGYITDYVCYVKHYTNSLNDSFCVNQLIQRKSNNIWINKAIELLSHVRDTQKIVKARLLW